MEDVEYNLAEFKWNGVLRTAVAKVSCGNLLAKINK